ncbi:hypothetical protein HUT27_29760 [Pseudomonas chlororaphis]|uniref:hypothetical protein n=1 Tax=Pseudomonas chlororaphis TaxID=587753 RepID=UPI001B317F02|nr:hypothetical protein [Pseudomonas chlororaphis]MBP5060560.1 hypothetical protein [Pseudomonas chlororaphis]QTT97509.1 hypothetical protein HUT27_29760 [Pseudomonas chlororaphis]
MRKERIFAALVAALVCSGAVQAQNQAAEPAACRAASEAAVSAQKIADTFKDRIESNAKQYEYRAKQIEEDAPNPDNAAEAGVKIDFDVTMKRQDFALDLPQVTMKSKAMAMDLPTMEMRRQNYSWDNPTVVMRMQCVDGPPELVCDWKMKQIGFIKTKVWECSTRKGDQMCTEIPEFEMRKQEASWDVPTVIVKRVDWSLAVPEIAMKRQDIGIDLPSITVKNIEAQMQETQDAANELAEKASAESQALEASMKSEITAASSSSLLLSFECEDARMLTMRDDALRDIDAQIATLQTSRDAAMKNNANQLAGAFDQGLEQLITARAKVVDEMEKARQELFSARDQALTKVNGGALMTGAVSAP